MTTVRARSNAATPAGPGGGARSSEVGIGILIVVVAAGVAAALTPPILAAVTALGRQIASTDVASDYVKGVLWAIALGASLLLWPVSRAERRVLGALWGVKCAVTLGFMLLYEWFYTSLDSNAYFLESQRPTFDWSTVRLGEGTHLVEALAWLHAHWLVASYHAMKVSCSMLGLVAVFVFYRAAALATGRRRLFVLVALGCFPSILFWSSILGKDPIAFLGIALYAYGVTGWLRGARSWPLPVAAVGLFVAVAIRLWLGPILLVPLALVGVIAVRGWGRRIVVLVLAGAAFAALLVPLRRYLAVEAFSDALSVVQSSSQSWAEGGSAQHISANLSNPVELVKFVPRGMAAALFRPLPGEIMNPFGLLAGLENLVVLLLLAVAIRRARAADFRDAVIQWAIAYVLIWGLVYGPISYQNLGTAVRFRLQVLPVMLLVLAYLARPRAAAIAPTPHALSSS